MLATKVGVRQHLKNKHCIITSGGGRVSAQLMLFKNTTCLVEHLKVTIRGGWCDECCRYLRQGRQSCSPEALSSGGLMWFSCLPISPLLAKPLWSKIAFGQWEGCSPPISLDAHNQTLIDCVAILGQVARWIDSKSISHPPRPGDSRRPQRFSIEEVLATKVGARQHLRNKHYIITSGGGRVSAQLMLNT